MRGPCLVLLCLWLLACAERPMKVPGETDIAVSEVTIAGRDGAALEIDPGPLYDRLGMRAKSLVLPGRYYSEFREHEDRRRIEAYWHSYGFFDVEVSPPLLAHDRAENSVAVSWTVKENGRYTIAAVELRHAPDDFQAELAALVPFAAGAQSIDLEAFRKVREQMADVLRRAGFGHAMVYSRAFVDRTAKAVHWYYYVDAGPQTRVGTVVVDGAVHVPAEVVMERIALYPGDPFDLETKLAREQDLLDTGAYAAVFIRTNADTVFLVPGDAPDTGGILRPEQVDANGNLVPRKLPEALDLEIHVVEAPSRQLRLRASAEFDPDRVDTALGARVWLRNLFGPLHHLVLEGRIGYGWLWRSDSEDPSGLYGEALVRYLKPMLLGRRFDFRLSARLRDELYDSFHLREVTAGPGGRSTLARGLFLDGDVLFRFAQQLGFGPFDETTIEEHALARDDDYLGGELQLGLVWDRRDNPVEPRSGPFLALHGAYSPGGTDRWNRYLTVAPEGRAHVPIGAALSLGLRAGAGWALLASQDGIPLGPRLFGGGAHGMRGYGRSQLSPLAPSCPIGPTGAPVCRDVTVGGRSLFEGSIEGRLLPPQKPYGAVVFADLGGAGAAYDPFARGVSLAAGLGLRLRFWYLPAAFDFAYRILADSELQEPDDDPFKVFFRIGEAF